MTHGSPLRVGFDATACLGGRTGIGVFAQEVLTRIGADGDLDVTAFAITWRGRGDLAASVPPGVRLATRPMPARPLRELWKRTDHPTVRPWIGRVDVVHGPNFVVPPGGGAAELVTVHDLTPVTYPELCSADTLAYPTLIARALRRGAWVHTPSRFVADEVVAHFGVSPDRVVAIPNGVSEFAPATPASDAAAGRRLAGGERYVLALGTIEPRKNLNGLVAAFDLVAADDPDVRLVIGGPDGWGIDAFRQALAAARHRDRIVQLGWVDDDQRAGLLRGAALLAYPSRYEGFGLPPLEAMSVGVPVVTTDAGAVPEVVGDAARLVRADETDPAELAAAIAEVLRDESVRSALIAAGHDRVAQYTWVRTASSLAELYRTIAPR